MDRKRVGCVLITLFLAWQPLVQASGPERSAQSNYILRCAGCHGMDGKGVETAGIPPFPGFVDVFFNDAQSRLYLMHVPGVVGSSLTNDEIAEVMNYVVDQWGASGEVVKHFTPDEVSRLRQQPVKDVVVLRRNISERLSSEGVDLPEYTWP